MENNIPTNDKILPTSNHNITVTTYIKIYLDILRYLIFKDYLITRRLIIKYDLYIVLHNLQVISHTLSYENMQCGILLLFIL